MASFSFDASTVQPSASFSVLPAGSYLAMITDSDIVSTKAGDGQILKLTFDILDGEFKGRKVWNNLNVQNPNATAQQIAQADLSSICHILCVTKLQDTAALHNKPLKIKVTVRPASGQYNESNNIKGYEAAVAGVVIPGVSAGVITAAKPAAANKPAWAK